MNGNSTGNDYAADDLVSLITNPETIGGAVDAIKEIVGSEQVNQVFLLSFIWGSRGLAFSCLLLL